MQYLYIVQDPQQYVRKLVVAACHDDAAAFFRRQTGRDGEARFVAEMPEIRRGGFLSLRRREQRLIELIERLLQERDDAYALAEGRPEQNE
jgi:hypothetical protein